MNKAEFLSHALAGRTIKAKQRSGEHFAPVNIALGKYWGKRDIPGNLPTNDSLSITLPKHGTNTKVEPSEADLVVLNGEAVEPTSKFYVRLVAFLDALDPTRSPLKITTVNNIATAAGLASSASGFAALIGALDQLCDWQLSLQEHSILARIGSGSASRSIANGFVRWHRGQCEQGSDSFAKPINTTMPELAIGLMTLTSAEKAIGSTQGMQQTLASCPLFNAWPDFANQSVERLVKHIEQGDIDELMSEAEHNAMTMHATMIATKPSILYWQAESVAVMHQIWALRQQGLDIYFTMDAGPNIKLLFKRNDEAVVREHFPSADIILPFEHL